jgi:hypothetical protein
MFICLCLWLRFQLFVCLMVFNATFNNISAMSWWSVLLVEETGVPGENHRTVASHWQTLSYNVVHLVLIVIRTHNIGVMDTDCICSCKSNYHTMTATTAPDYVFKSTEEIINFKKLVKEMFVSPIQI